MVFYQYIISKEKEDKTMFKKNVLLKSPDSTPKEKYLLLFAVAFIGMMISFIPSMIVNQGIFLYYGDVNSQQMMFYQHCHDAVRSGNIGSLHFSRQVQCLI